jgi:FdhD protein
VNERPSPEAHRQIGVRIHRDGGAADASDELAVESPLEIRVECAAGDGRLERRSIVALRTPGADVELAAGLLVTEGVVLAPDEIEWIEEESDGIVSVRLRSDPGLLPEARTTFISSSCGACGKATIAALKVGFTPRDSSTRTVSCSCCARMWVATTHSTSSSVPSSLPGGYRLRTASCS